MSKPRVLVADDNDAICTLLKALLQREYEVEFATDGLEAIERLRTRRYAAVLLDLLMPVADGFTVLEYLRTERPDILPNVIVVTAAAGSAEASRVLEYGVCRIVRKPFEVDTLLGAVRDCADPSEDMPRSTLISGTMLLLFAEMISGR